MEVRTLVTLLILVVFLLVALGAIIVLYQQGNIFSGEGSVCESTLGFLGGCT